MDATLNWTTALPALQAVLPPDCIDDAPTALQRYGADTGGAQRRLLGALRPRQRDDVQAVLRWAHAHRVALHPISTGRNWGYGSALPSRDDVALLDLGGMNRILHFDEAFGVVTLEPGVTQAQLADFLDQHHLPYLVPVTGAGPSCSVLANALERGYGVTPHTDHFAAVNDLEAVLPDGTLYQGMLREAAGPELARLFRWGLGAYTHGLFTQSGLGVVTQMSIALAPKPECVMACLFSVNDDRKLEAAVAGIRQALQRLNPTLGAINLMNRHRMLSMSAPYPAPHELNDAGCIPPELVEALGRRYQVMPWTGFATLYGSRRMVAAAQKELRHLLAGTASRMLFLSPERARTLAQLARWLPGRWGQGLQGLTHTLAQSLQLVAGRPNETALPLAYWRTPGYQPVPGQARDPGRDGCGLLWYAPLVPMQGPRVRAYVDLVTRHTVQHRLEPLITFTTVNDKLFDSTVPLVFDKTQPGAAQATQQCYEALLREGRPLGYFPYRFGIDGMALLREHAPAAAALARRLHAVHDPHGLLAPGRYR